MELFECCLEIWNFVLNKFRTVNYLGNFCTNQLFCLFVEVFDSYSIEPQTFRMKASKYFLF